MEFVPCWNMFIFGISLLYIVYINAPIYLVKGGRLGLMPGVLFHSCRPSFCHTGVMFLDFAFLTRLGYNGNPLIVRLDKSFSSNAQPWFYHLPPSLFFPLAQPTQGSSLFKPLGQCSSECWSNLSAAGGHQGQLWAGLPEVWTIRCCPENEICAAPIEMSAHRAVLLVLFYHCRNVL